MPDNTPLEFFNLTTPEPVARRPEDEGLFSGASKVNLIILCIVLFVFTGLMLTEYLTQVVCMLAASLILTYILLGPVELLQRGLLAIKVQRHGLPKGLCKVLSILLVYLLFFGCIVIALIQVAPPLASQIKDFARELPHYLSQVSDTQNRGSGQEPLAAVVQASLERSQKLKHPETETTSATNKRHAVAELVPRPTTSAKMPLVKATYTLALEQLINNYKTYAAKLGGVLLDLGSATFSTLIYGLTTLVLVFYLLHDGKELQHGLVNLFPARHEAGLERFLIRLHLQFQTIVKGQLLMSLISGSLMYILLLALGAKFSLLLSVFFGITSILPVIGPWVGLVPIISFLAFSSHPLDILTILMGTELFYILKTYWLWPKLIRRKYDIHPILFTLSFVACLKLAGPLGILLSFPLASILGVIAASTKEHHARQKAQLPT